MPTPAATLINAATVMTNSFVVVEWFLGALVLFLALPIGFAIGRRLFSAAKRAGGG